MRAKRDWLLAESDWTQLADCPIDEVDRLVWFEYRAELRDVHQQGGFPGVVDWPEIPE
ncbi:hypothetical protein PSDVSF_10760 [Pseudodesulfovibrio sediminis]|uniref:Phage tail assembly chaperone-like domain-containing protein n=1 Tax=Pseudodesulfovibrio sediminis TaxID=2810563 RepID=A0ABN6ERZ1_9BACT|nr:hypothetical protein PSDVSF_10760 [Pseudodesulfovibrio sediminis]